MSKEEKSFLASQRRSGMSRKEGTGKKVPGRPSKDAQIQRALRDDTVEFFKKILDDEMEEKLWMHFLSGRVQEVNVAGEPILDKNGRPTYHEITGVSWNAFRQMVAYKRGMPAIKVDKVEGDGSITVNFNVMGASNQQMERQVRDLGLLPQSST